MYESISKMDVSLSENECMYKQILGDVLKYIKEPDFCYVLEILLYII